MTPAPTPLPSEGGPVDTSNEPLEHKLIAAASDGYVNITPEKVEHIKGILANARAPDPNLARLVEALGPFEKVASQIERFGESSKLEAHDLSIIAEELTDDDFQRARAAAASVRREPT